jgi:hypothetical protein
MTIGIRCLKNGFIFRDVNIFGNCEEDNHPKSIIAVV